MKHRGTTSEHLVRRDRTGEPQEPPGGLEITGFLTQAAWIECGPGATADRSVTAPCESAAAFRSRDVAVGLAGAPDGRGDGWRVG